MAQKTGIEWTDSTWSPIRVRVRKDAAEIARAKGYDSLVQIAEKMAGRVGQHCEHISPGCLHCYAETNNHRCLPANGTGLPYDRRSRDLVEAFIDEKVLLAPLKWGPVRICSDDCQCENPHTRPRRIFVENQSDLFAEWVTDEMLDRVHVVMALCPQHIFQTLTKRADRQLKYFSDIEERETLIGVAAGNMLDGSWIWNEGKKHRKRIEQIVALSLGLNPDGETFAEGNLLPLPNVHRGVSVEDQKMADERVPVLQRTPAAVRYLSCEPLLERIDLETCIKERNPGEKDIWSKSALDDSDVWYSEDGDISDGPQYPKIDWVIAGCESGPGARAVETNRFRLLRDQCAAAGVPFFLKQMKVDGKLVHAPALDGVQHLAFPEARG